MWLTRRDLGLVIPVTEECARGPETRCRGRGGEERQFRISDDFPLESPRFS